MSHSYIIELKYARYKDPESRVEELRAEAVAQANHYADTDRVERYWHYATTQDCGSV